MPSPGASAATFGYHIPYPVVNERGTGARLIDVDGTTISTSPTRPHRVLH